MKVSPSLLAFICVIILFFTFFKLFGDYPNALTIVWAVMILLLLIAYIYTKSVIYKKMRNAKIAELGLTTEQAQGNKELHRVARRMADGTFIGEFSGYFWIFCIIFFFRAWGYEPFKIPSGSMQPTLEVGDFIAVNKHHYRIASPIQQNTWIKLNDIERGDVVVFKSPLHFEEDWIKRVVGLPGDIVYYNQELRQVQVISHCRDPYKAAVAFAGQVTRSDKAIESDDVDACKLIDIQYTDFKHDYQFTLNTNNLPEKLVNRNEIMERSNGTYITHETLQYPQAFDYSSALYKQDNVPLYFWVVPEGQYFMMGDNRDNSEDSRFVGFIPYENIVGKAEYIWFSMAHQVGGKDANITFANWSRMFRRIDGHLNFE